MKNTNITFNNVVNWLVALRMPRADAVKACSGSVYNGLRIYNKMKAYDKKQKVGIGKQETLFDGNK